MRKLAFILLVGLPMAGLSQGQPSSVCDTIKQLHRRYAALPDQRVQLQRRHTENHPDAQAVLEQLASLEATLATEKTRAASQGLDCY